MKIPRSAYIAAACCLLLLPASGAAQVNGAIAGVVRDSSGAVMPGVTVEATSPALIEKVRVVVSDAQGLYRIVDLRPGVYTVTFSLPGFSTLRREGVELSAAFTATVNAELSVGALEETLTVSGAAPIVDTQNVLQQQTLARDTLDAIPTTKRLAAYATLVPGAIAGTQDVGGVMGERGAAFSIHGGRSADISSQQDGMHTTIFNSTIYSFNPHMTEEVVLQTGGISAESPTAGVLINIVPKGGGNVFSGGMTTAYSSPDLQNSNLTDDLRARGLASTPSVRKVYDVGGSVGGPVRRDRLWFFTAHRKWAASRYVPGNFWNAAQDEPVGTDPVWRVLLYRPDPSRPAYTNDFYRDHSLRLTWQISSKDKLAASYSVQQNCNCPIDDLAAGGNVPAPEGTGYHYYDPNYVFTSSWTRPATNRLLFEAGMGASIGGINAKRPPGVSEFDIPVTELSTNTRYGSRGTGLGNAGSYSTNNVSKQYTQRFSVSYITGTHSVKVGANFLAYQQRHRNFNAFNQIHGARAYSFRNGVPTSITLFATPFGVAHQTLSTGFFGQDQWTIRKLTLNVGVRYDSFNGSVDEQHFPAGLFVPARDLPAVKDSPDWKNINPRMGAAYDLFGNGRTAVKAFLGRYVIGTSGNSNQALNNPISNQANSATRTWNDANRNYVPDCVLGASVPGANGECGALSDQAFGQIRAAGTTRYDEAVLAGDLNGGQGYNWQGSVGVQHELVTGIGVNVAYFRTWYGNFNVTENQALTPTDFDPYCVTAPTDPRLPGGGGDQVCGMYDIRPTRFGQVNNVITPVKNFGERTEVFNGVDVTLNARFGEGGIVSGGMSVGRTVTDTCSFSAQPQVNDTNTTGFATLPKTEEYCRSTPPWSSGTQVKFLVVYPLPWGLQTSATYQNLAGIPIAASYTATNAQIRQSLGRDLGACRGAATCNATTTIALIPPNTLFEDRLQQVDLRFSRRFDLGRARLNANVDLYNAFNGSSVLSSVTAYGPRYLNAVNILAGRLLKVGFQVDF
ncbi:MAG: hypothetical protein A3G81_25390 [Betaproteobacteria bacterium RIFCSPLOWO2_12_FULL_65_14]|nr:MAG: hypothetical protein A3H29_05365 [Acidobacteria bacterium RIFCSPLOWO2_02_FULL_67_21]OGA61902.1 MAG: hypothetical protein A3G81_25390 [Betaproteobacteria bacterium RIFCSPLOWO2_12_FULL_65_14]